MRNILPINEMIDMLEDFVENSTDRQIIVGGMAGTQIFKHVVDVVLEKTNFENICVIEGCQDYIGLTNPSPCNNHFYYGDIMRETVIPNCDETDSYNHGYLLWDNMKLRFDRQVDINSIGKFHYLIINDLHLIPMDVVKYIFNQYPGKIIGICDPYEIHGERYIGCPNIIDTLSKVSAIVAMARATYNVDSRGIDKKVRCSVSEQRINHRTIGRTDDRQYITNDRFLADEIWNKQIQATYRKQHRLFITSERIHRFPDSSGYYHSITKNTMLVIDGTYMTTSKVRLRLFSSKFTFDSEISYMSDPPLSSIAVRPANIIMVDEIPYHRYQNTVLVANEQLTPREKYTLLKNTHNLVVAG